MATRIMIAERVITSTLAANSPYYLHIDHLGSTSVTTCASVLVTLPMLIIFFFGQRYFIEGIATTGIKG